MALKLKQEFKTGKDATAFIKDMAFENNFSVKIPMSSGDKKTVVCSCDGCPFTVRVRRYKSGTWYIASMCLDHINCTSVRKPTAEQLSRITTIKSAVAANPKITIKALTAEVQGNDGVNLQAKAIQCKLYRARVDVREEISGNYAETYKQLVPFLDAFVAANPGSTAVAEAHSDGSFRRALLIPGHLIAASCKNLRLAGVDGAHSHHLIYHGKQLLYVGVDGNGKTVTLACALVEGETGDDYNWFFSHIQAAGLLWDVPIFADRSSGLLSSVESTWLHLMHGTIHILRNIYHKFKRYFRKLHDSDIYKLQAATTGDAYERQMVAIGTVQSHMR